MSLQEIKLTLIQTIVNSDSATLLQHLGTSSQPTFKLMIKHIFLTVFVSVFTLSMMAQTQPISVRDTQLLATDTPLDMDGVLEAISHSQKIPQGGIEGVVILEITIDRRGRYQSHKVVHSEHPLLLAIVEESIPRLKLKPFIRNGFRVKGTFEMPFNLRLVP